MPEKDPTTYSMLTYTYVIGLSVWSGVSSYLHKVRRGVCSRFSFTELIGELVTSALAGVLTFWLCELSDIDPLMSAGLIAISGHMGARAIFMFEQMIEKRYGIKLPDDKDGSGR